MSTTLPDRLEVSLAKEAIVPDIDKASRAEGVEESPPPLSVEKRLQALGITPVNIDVSGFPIHVPTQPDVGGRTISRPEVVASVKVPLFGAPKETWSKLTEEKIARQKVALGLEKV